MLWKVVTCLERAFMKFYKTSNNASFSYGYHIFYILEQLQYAGTLRTTYFACVKSFEEPEV